MSLFFLLFVKLLPLYALIGVGFVWGRKFGDQSQYLSRIQMYLILPVILLASMMKVEVQSGLFMLPVCLFALCLSLSAGTNFIARKMGSPYAPLLAQAAGSANMGYLGIPIALAVFPKEYFRFIWRPFWGPAFTAPFSAITGWRGVSSARAGPCRRC